MKTFKPLLVAAVALGLAGSALADITVGVSLPLTGPASALGIPMQNDIELWPTAIGRREAEGDHPRRRHRPDAGGAERAPLRHRGQGRRRSIGSAATPIAIAMSRRRRRSADGAADVLAGGAAGRQGPLVVPPAAVGNAVMAHRGGRAHEEAGRQDGRLPRLHRRLRRSLAQRLPRRARREGRHQDRRDRALRAPRHQRDRRRR